jgi:hypothetical protein
VEIIETWNNGVDLVPLRPTARAAASQSDAVWILFKHVPENLLEKINLIEAAILHSSKVLIGFLQVPEDIVEKVGATQLVTLV